MDRSSIASLMVLYERFYPFAAVAGDAWDTQDVEYRVPTRYSLQYRPNGKRWGIAARRNTSRKRRAIS